MKKISLFVITLSVFVACKKASNEAKSLQAAAATSLAEGKEKEVLTSISIDKDIYYFDTIKQGDKIETDFKITNTGVSDLTIKSLRGSCGCTVPKMENKIIKPNRSENIHVVFNSSHKRGVQNKTVTLVANIPDKIQILRLKGYVAVDEVSE